jgi:hypothetical protein
MYVYDFLRWIPALLLFAILEWAFVGVLWPMRGKLEGWEYNNSRASEWGDRGFALAIAIGTTVLRETHAIPPIIMQKVAFWGGAAIAVGIIWQVVVVRKYKRFGTITDFYHNIIVVPLIIFLLVTTVPITFMFGSIFWKVITAAMGPLWLGLLLFDRQDGRLQQVEFVLEHSLDQLTTWIAKNKPKYEEDLKRRARERSQRR